MTSQFQWRDPFLLDQQLNEEERMAREYSQSKLMPRILQANRSERFDREIYHEMAALGGVERTAELAEEGCGLI